MSFRSVVAVSSLLSMFLVSSSSSAAEMETIGFAKALATAKERSPNVKIAVADIARAVALARQARAAVFPTLIGNGVYTRLDDDRRVGDRIAQGRDSLSLSVTAGVPLIQFQRWGALRRADDQAHVVDFNEKAIARDVVVGAARSYLAVLLQKRAVEVAIRARDTSKAHFDYSVAREKGGLGSKLDAVRAGQELETSETQVAQSTLSLLRTQEAHGIALGLDHAVDAEEEPSLTIDEKAVKPRADVEAAKESVRAANRGTNDLFRDFIPTLSGTFQPFYQNPPTLTLPETGWQAQLLLTVPFFDGGLRYGQQREREALLVQAQARLEDINRRATTDLRLGKAAIIQAETVLTRAREAARLAREAARLSQIAYESGAATNLEVVDADRRARDADTQAALAEDGFRQARLDWLAATGVIE